MRGFAGTTSDIIAPMPSILDYSFIAASATITITGFVWTSTDSGIRTGTPFTASLLTSEAQNILDFIGAAALPTGTTGFTMTASGSFYFTCDGSETALEANPTRCPLIAGPTTRSFGNVPPGYLGMGDDGEVVIAAGSAAIGSFTVTPNKGTPATTTPSITNTTSFTILAANAARNYLLIQNDSAANILISLSGATLTGIAPTSTNIGLVLIPGASYSAEGSFVPTSAITAYQSSGGTINTVVVVEG